MLILKYTLVKIIMTAVQGSYCNITLIIVLFICNHIMIVAIIKECKSMILSWICNKLIQKRDKEYHKVIKLKWQKAELEKRIATAKAEK